MTDSMVGAADSALPNPLVLARWLHFAGLQDTSRKPLEELIQYASQQGADARPEELKKKWRALVTELRFMGREKAANVLEGRAVPLWLLGGTLLRDRRRDQGVLIVADNRSAGVPNYGERVQLNRGVPAVAVVLAADPEFDWRLPKGPDPDWRFLAQASLVGFVQDGVLYAGLNPTVGNPTPLRSDAWIENGAVAGGWQEFGKTRLQPRSQFVRVTQVVRLTADKVNPSLTEAVWAGSSKAPIPPELEAALAKMKVWSFKVEDPEKFDSYRAVAEQFQRQYAGLEEKNLKSVTLLVFDPASAPALARRLKPQGADLFAVAETPRVARALLREGLTPDRIIGVVGKGWGQRDYHAVTVSPRIQHFASGASSLWKEAFLERFRADRPTASVFPIYNAEQLTRILTGLQVPMNLIQAIEQERAGMEEAVGGEA